VCVFFTEKCIQGSSPLEGQKGEGAIVTVVRHLHRLNLGPPNVVLQQKILLLCSSFPCMAGVEMGVLPGGVTLFLGCGVLPLRPCFLENHFDVTVSVPFQMPRAAAPHTLLHSSVNSAQLNLSCLKCTFKPR
jgi:hypothetical protein